MTIPERRATISRHTNETQIELTLDLDGGPIEIDSGVKFFDHMLDAFAKHSGSGLVIRARGDGMDNHHLVEDVAIALGRGIYDALGEKRGIARFGSISVPLDDALVHASVDLSGRAWSNVRVRFEAEDLGDFKTEMVPHFFHSLADNGRFNVHLIALAGENAHHLCEASFKSFARAFAQAKTRVDDASVPSTKGLLA